MKRYLDGRPVEARPLSHLYRFRKFADRHRLAVAATALVAALLIAGTVFALRQRGLAEQRFAQIRALANSVLFEIHDEIFKLPGSLDARHLLASRGVQYLDALAASAGTDSALQLEAARGFVRLADIEGVSNEPSLGQSSRAMRRIERAGQMVRAVLDRAPHDYEALSAHYVVLEALSSVYSLHGDARAIPTAEELLRVSETLAAARPNDGKVKEELAHALFVVANTYTQSRTHGSRGVDAWRRAVAAWKALYEEKPDSLDRKRELARSYQFLAGALSRAVKREEARETALLAYGMHKELALIDDEEIDHMLAADVGLLANLSAQLKRYADAVPLFQEQLRLREKLAAKDPNNLNALMGIAGTMDRIGLAYLRLNRPEEGLSFLERSLEQQRAVLAKDPDNVLVNREMLYVLTDLTEANEALKRRDRMCRYANETTVILKGPIARTRETPTDAAKKQYVKKVLAACASSAGD